MLGVYDIAFAAVSVLMIVSSLFIFFSRRLVHAILALTTAFIGSALVFLLLGQVFVAMLQLLIFVGGLSTYLMVAIAYEEKQRRYVSYRTFFVVAIVLVFCLYAFTYRVVGQESPNGYGMVSAFGPALQGYYFILFAVVVLLFAAAVGSVLFLKKFTKVVT
jgi:NADH:ubiquinone oxidoreductase subunit 6 (subunit J)